MYNWIPLKLRPGFLAVGTVYESKNRWYDGNFVRFFQGCIRPIGGWVDTLMRISGSPVTGIARAMYAWTWDIGGLVSFATGTSGVSGEAKLTVSYVLPTGDNTVDITPASDPAVNRTWEMDNFGNYLLAVAVDALGVSTPYVWDADLGNPATAAMTGAPQAPLSVVVTPERFVMLLGGGDPLLGDDVWRTVWWADRETYDSWVPGPGSTAGNFPLASKGVLVCGRRGKRETLLWTTDDLWRAEFIGGELVYGFTQVGNTCGIVGSKAVAQTDSMAYWMGPNGFHAYDGYVRPIDCEVHDRIFSDINQAHLWKAWAFHNALFNEVTWYYPSADSTECDRYATYNYVDGTWVTGIMTRTAGVSAPASMQLAGQIMLAGVEDLDADPFVAMYRHESGNARDDGAWIESGPAEIGDGDNLISLQKIMPDERLAGDVELVIKHSKGPNFPETTSGPFPLLPETSLRVKNRQMRIRLQEAEANPWRVGTFRAGIQPSSRR